MLDTPLHPQIASFLGGIFVLYGVGLLLALGSRILWQHFKSSRNGTHS